MGLDTKLLVQKERRIFLFMFKNAKSNLKVEMYSLVINHNQVNKVAKIYHRMYNARGWINYCMRFPCHIERILTKIEKIFSKPEEISQKKRVLQKTLTTQKCIEHKINRNRSLRKRIWNQQIRISTNYRVPPRPYFPLCDSTILTVCSNIPLRP